MSEEQRDKLIAGYVLQRTEARKRHAEIDATLQATGKRMESIGGALRTPHTSKERLDALLNVGVEFPFDVTKISELLEERNRLNIAIEDCGLRLRNMGAE